MIRINNRKNFLIGDIPSYHPDSANYLKYWRDIKKKCIEGFWGIDNIENIQNGFWRYMPGRLFFYVNLGTILHQEEGKRSAPKKKMRPYLRDIEWEFAYNWIEARGFSGFELDNEYTCCRDVIDTELVTEEYHHSCFDKDGNVKKYIPAKEYLRKLHNKPLGKALFNNSAKNLFLLSARGIGKSFIAAIMMALYDVLFDGATEYNEESIKNPAEVEVFVGAALTSKSSDLLKKLKAAFDNLPGAFGSGDNYVPSPLSKSMCGTLAPNNMKNPWRHEYKKKVGGQWIDVGTKSNIKHGIYTVDNAEAAVGTRPLTMIIEEVGLASNVLSIHGANTACMTEGNNKFGSALYIGTGGSIEKIVESEIIFRDPRGFDFIEFDDTWENTGKICWFIPAYYAFNDCKDENGNTDIEKAADKIRRRREEKKKSKSVSAINNEMMYFPIVPSEIFLSVKKSKFSVEDLRSRLGTILSDANIMHASLKGRFKLLEGQPEWEMTDDVPIREFPVRDRNTKGCVEIFELAKKNFEGKIPYGRYISGLDPIDDDDIGENLSLQSFWIMDTWTSRLVLEYTARTNLASEFYEQVRRALIYYNASLLYENQKKGLYAYFSTKNCTYLLADTPEILKDMNIQRPGFGNKSKGVWVTEPIIKWGIDLIASWLIEQAYDMPEGMTNLETIRSVALLRELIAYGGDINTDRISSLLILMIYRESLIKHIENTKNQNKTLAEDEFWDRNFNTKKKFDNSRMAFKNLSKLIN